MDRQPDQNTASLEELYAAYGRRVHGLAFRMTGDAEAARDITQEVFLRVYRNLPRFRGESRIFTWIFAIARNACARHLRRARKTSFRSLAGLIDRAGEEPSPAAYAGMEREYYVRQVKDGCLLGLLRCLCFNQRIAFILYFLFDLPIDEIAAVVGKSANAARLLAHRARVKIKSFLCANCSLYDASNPCRCEKLVSFSLKRNWIRRYDPAVAPSRIEAEIKALRDEVLLCKTIFAGDPGLDLRSVVLASAKTPGKLIFSRKKVK
jgi:RNA polymerase sigma factor (sigma-70 family)